MKRFVALLLVSIACFSAEAYSAEELSPQEQLKAWGQEFVGTWMNESTLDTDLPGLGKKGDKLVGEITFKEVNGVYQGTWSGEVNGKPTDFGVAAIGWDGGRQGIRVQWFTKNAAAVSVVYALKAGEWSNRFVLVSPDGTKSVETSRLTTSGDKHVFKITKRKRGDKPLPDKEETWTKK